LGQVGIAERKFLQKPSLSGGETPVYRWVKQARKMKEATRQQGGFLP
jgi:hypothetical protein